MSFFYNSPILPFQFHASHSCPHSSSSHPYYFLLGRWQMNGLDVDSTNELSMTICQEREQPYSSRGVLSSVRSLSISNLLFCHNIFEQKVKRIRQRRCDVAREFEQCDKETSIWLLNFLVGDKFLVDVKILFIDFCFKNLCEKFISN